MAVCEQAEACIVEAGLPEGFTPEMLQECLDGCDAASVEQRQCLIDADCDPNAQAACFGEVLP